MFTGRRFDQETGLYYYRARYYSPDLGRFLQTDPVENYGLTSLYDYCFNNPVIWIDPEGMDGYIVNRQFVNPFGGGEKARSYYNPLTHTLTATTDEQGNVEHTYSRVFNKWEKDKPKDIKTAQKAIDKGKAKKITDEVFDDYIDKAYEEVKDDKSLLDIDNNCKHNTKKLLKRAIELYREENENKSRDNINYRKKLEQSVKSKKE